jgi:PBSX family phage terminase large subunit
MEHQRTTEDTHRLEVLPQQLRFLRSNAREILYSGAFGAGKTRAICLRVAMRASVQGSREGLCRKTVVALKRSTLKTLLEPDGLLPPILPRGSYEYKKIDGEILIHGGGSIMLFGLEDAGRIASMNLSGVAVDECVELTEQDWTMLRGRIRLQLPNLQNQLYGACNPSTPQHFLAQRFGLAGGHVCAPNCEAITTTSRDNWFLPEDYVKDLETMTGVARKRYVEGLWVGSDGLVYDMWDESKFVVDEVPDSYDRMIVGMDYGYNNPSVLLLAGIKDERMFIIDEWHERQKLEAEIIDTALKWKEEHPMIECFVVDPSCAGIRASMRHVGLDVMPANNSVFSGIQTVASRLSNGDDGKPKLVVHRQCSNLLREFGSYEWMNNQDGSSKDIPRKEHDHCLDSLRYLAQYCYNQRTSPSIRSIDGMSDNLKNNPHGNQDMWTEF